MRSFFRPSGEIFFKERRFAFRPVTRSRHSSNERGFRVERISRITSRSGTPNCSLIASNGTSSAHAIATISETTCLSIFINLTNPPILASHTKKNGSALKPPLEKRMILSQL